MLRLSCVFKGCVTYSGGECTCNVGKRNTDILPHYYYILLQHIKRYAAYIYAVIVKAALCGRQSLDSHFYVF